MKKFYTALMLVTCFVFGQAQWSPTTFRGEKIRNDVKVSKFYALDIQELKSQLKNAEEMGQYSTPVTVSIPTMGGKVERFSIYSFPVVVKELAEQYDLGSYVGVGIDDPTKSIRFSLSQNDFQSMVIKDGSYEFIEPLNSDKTVYGIFPKTKKETGPHGFVCTTEEGKLASSSFQSLEKNQSGFNFNNSNYNKASDKKYRTMRLVVSVNYEYAQYFGGTNAATLAAINATLTRVNGVFEKDFALHLNLQNYTNILYTAQNGYTATTDEYTAWNVGNGMGDWNLQLQNTLTTNVGNANYDIGHLFGATGGGGSAGCIGCVCINPTTSVPEGKGSGYTSPSNGVPQGDTFDIDYVAHEMGHQLGGNHTFSHGLEPYGVNMEPGSGSTIMGYAGITTADVQNNSDPYFHVASILQVQSNLMTKTCDVETTIANNPPVVTAYPNTTALTDVTTIPKGTAFVLSATVTDPENNPMTYTWEQFDSATSPVTLANLANNDGANFRSLIPTTSPTRYFPKLSTVLAGSLSSTADWEAVPNAAKTTSFAITIRDNHPTTTQQQTASYQRFITFGADGPFKVNTQFGFSDAPTAITWDVANTNATPYNATNVKIDYTTNMGTTWTTLIASTPNDGSENVNFPASLNGQTAIVRVSAVESIFYAVKSVSITTAPNCGAGVPSQYISATNITANGASLSWAAITGATSYVIRYKTSSSSTWQTTTSTTNSVNLSSLIAASLYEVQIAAVCSGTTGVYGNSFIFSTLDDTTYCPAASNNMTDDHIANVTLANVNNSSGASTYTNYGNNSALIVKLVPNTTYTLSVTKGWLSGNPYPGMVSAWIDFNNNGTFETTERILTAATNTTTNVNPVTASFTAPATTVTGTVLKMRVAFNYSQTSGATITNPCPTNGVYANYGEVEDYSVVVDQILSTRDLDPESEFSIYPNPVSDILNITKVSNKAKFQIVDAAGRLVKSGSVKDNKVEVYELLKGNYIITITDDELTQNFKFIKK